MRMVIDTFLAIVDYRRGDLGVRVVDDAGFEECGCYNKGGCRIRGLLCHKRDTGLYISYLLAFDFQLLVQRGSCRWPLGCVG